MLAAGCTSTPPKEDVSAKVYYFPKLPAKPSNAGAGGAGDGANSSGLGAGGVGSGVPTVTASNLGENNYGPAGVSKIVYFDFDSYVVKPEYQGIVTAHAKYLVANRDRKATLEGHTDSRGGREYNLALGQRRAEAVRKSLALQGVPDSQLEAVSFGMEKPASTEQSEKGYAQNRRAEFRYR